VWRADLEQPPDVVQRLLRTLDADEQTGATSRNTGAGLLLGVEYCGRFLGVILS
jgi:hypothetical protein